MDEAGIAHAVACPVDRCLAVHNTEGNDLLIGAVRRHPDRLTGMAAANPWFEEKAAGEVRRALGKGLRGLVLNPVYQGFRLSDHLVDPLLEVAAEFKVPVYAHTGTAGIAEPFHAVELARRFPAVNFIMGHAGSSDYGEDAVRALEFADNIWLETSRNGPANYNFWRVKGCIGRVVFGSSAPEYIPAIEMETLCDVVTDGRDREAVFANTLRTVFGGRLGS
jgi:predicted TIM-barrel fold metal-dependent hydrolase